MVGTVTILSLVLSTGITSACLQVFFDKLANLALKKIGQCSDVADKLQKLGRTLQKIQSLVDDAEKKQSNSSACLSLVEDFKSVLFDADDLLDKIYLEILYSGDNDLSSLKSDLKNEVSQMLKEVDDLVKEMEGYFISEVNKLPPPQTWAIPQTSSLVDESSVVGRDVEKKEIVDMLLAERTENVAVISIVGMGGTGKTTLAQLAYNDAAVARKFKLRMWVCVSLDSDLVHITKSIFESATKKVLELSNLDSVQIELQKKIRGKQCLLVLDDVWNENPSDWDALKLPFRCAAPGSMIVVTTRSEIVSSMVSTVRAYPLHTLSNHEVCHTIIKQCLSKNLDGHEDLDECGLKMIADKCKGLPLAAKVIGNALRFKSKKMEWNSVLNSELWDFPEDYKSQIYHRLKRSYDHLPGHLKRCFAYCSIFPHSFQFEKDDLIQLWAAEGFIQAQRKRRIEDIGREYFDDLRSRSFFQVSSSRGNAYEMHDFIHDVAKLVSNNLSFRLEDSMSCLKPISSNVRHYSLLELDQNNQQWSSEEFYRYEKLRTFILLDRSAANLKEVPYDIFEKLPCLRVLNLSRSGIKGLPDSIGKLIHLRYLNLSYTRIKKLPKSIEEIRGLEILKLEHCDSLLELPQNLKKLIKLRRLDFHRCKDIDYLPMEVGKLTILENLDEFKVKLEKGYQIEELRNMERLGGSICIKDLENVTDRGKAEAAMLDNKKYLEQLELHWNCGTRDATVEHEVLAGLKPHDRLKSLQVIGYLGSKFPNWIGNSSFCKLENIRLEKCQVCSVLPSLGELPALKVLFIEQMDTLTEVDAQFCGSPGRFPSLETLTFWDMPKLRIWSEINESGMPRLTKLSIVSCPELVTLPSVQHLTSLEKLSIQECDELPTLPGKELPHSLKSLIISESCILKERCKGSNGEDWNKIKFIPEVIIDDEQIPTERPISISPSQQL